jgi:predicted transcriptional regulator
MKTTTKTGGDRIPCGMVSLKMFQMNHSKALIIAYLNLRGGLKKYTFNQTDISNQTNIGKTVVRQYMKELVDEGVLNRRGKSFYKLNRQKMEELYYCNVSDSDAYPSENDANVSESDTDASESVAIHSSDLNSRKLDSSKLHTKKNTVPQLPAIAEELLSKSSKEQVEWLDDVEANKTLVRDLRNGKDVRWTKAFEDYFANL